MRAKLTDRVHVQEVFGNDFTLVMPYQVVVTELTEHFSNGQLRLQLGAMKAVIILNFLFVQFPLVRTRHCLRQIPIRTFTLNDLL